MIPDAIEVRLKPKERAELEARLCAATTEQRQLFKMRIVLCFLKRGLINRQGKHYGRIGKEFFDPGDVGLENALCTVDEFADLWQRGYR